jgi:hypothetical protein
MKIYGLAMVRNEADIIRVNVLYHLSLGFDSILIVDNGSTDGTDRILSQLSKDKRVSWTRDDSGYRQAEITTELAQEAFRSGAEWVAPIDADEFLYAAHGNLRELLATSTAGALRVQLVNFVQRREQRVCTPDALSHMTMRVAKPVGPLECCRELVESRQIGWVERMLPPKWISRASANLQIGSGNHRVSGVDGSLEPTDDIVILHAPIRSRATLDAKATQGRRVADPDSGFKPGEALHVRRFLQLQKEGTLEQEWMANSYASDCLDVYGAQHRLEFDPTLREILAPWTGVPPGSVK